MANMLIDIRPINLKSSDLSPVIALLSRVLAHEPSYIPTVGAHTETPEEWYLKKHTMLTNGAYIDDEIVGHIALREYQAYGKRYELCRLFVAPDQQRQGIASFLVQESFKSFSHEYWASTVQGSPSHSLFLHLGWRELGPISFIDDDAPGVVLAP